MLAKLDINLATKEDFLGTAVHIGPQGLMGNQTGDTYKTGSTLQLGEHRAGVSIWLGPLGKA